MTIFDAGADLNMFNSKMEPGRQSVKLIFEHVQKRPVTTVTYAFLIDGFTY